MHAEFGWETCRRATTCKTEFNADLAQGLGQGDVRMCPVYCSGDSGRSRFTGESNPVF